MAGDRDHSRSNSGATDRPLPDGAGLAQPPSPARIRGQRASLHVHRPSPYISHDRSGSRTAAQVEVPRLPGEEVDEFGLPIKVVRKSWVEPTNGEEEKQGGKKAEDSREKHGEHADGPADDSDATFESAEEDAPIESKPKRDPAAVEGVAVVKTEEMSKADGTKATENVPTAAAEAKRPVTPEKKEDAPVVELTSEQLRQQREQQFATMVDTATAQDDAIGGVSAASHQALAVQKARAVPQREEEDWQAMRAYGRYDVYNDDGDLVARGMEDSDDEDGLGGARKGYTKLQVDEDAESVNSMEQDTNYLFKGNKQPTADLLDNDDDDARDPLQQMQATKDMLTEGQRIAYVGLTRLSIAALVDELGLIDSKNKETKTTQRLAVDATKMWGQKMMVRLYAHMEIESSGMYVWHPTDRR